MKKFGLFLTMGFASILNAEQIKSIDFVNLTKISPTIAKETLDIKVGEELNVKKINHAIKEFYKFRYFDDIKVSLNNGKLEFLFKEKASIANVDIVGYKQRDSDIETLKSQIELKKGNLYSTKRVKRAKELLLKELEKEGYINSVVEVEIENLSEDSVSVTFNVNKGDEIVIKKVNYFGASELDDGDFEKMISNKEEEFASWFITQNDGELKANELQYDDDRIRELYLENGYLDAKVENPFLEVDFASNQAELDFYIKEGVQYTTNTMKIYIDSHLVKPKFFYNELKLKEGRTFNIKKLRKDIDFIRNRVADLGYAFTKVSYDMKKDDKNGTVDLIFKVNPGEKVFIRDVKISGNSRTLDRIIRRNVYLAPGDLFNMTDFNDSRNKLKRSGYFNDISIEQKRVSKDKMDLIVKVKEAPTGNIILGGGYGSSDGMMVSGSISEKNLFGSGIGLTLSADLSKSSSDFKLKLTNPSIRDSEYHGDIDIHLDKTEIDSTEFDSEKEVRGLSIGFGKEFIRNLRAGARYRLDFIKNNYTYETTSTVPTPNRFNDEEYITSSITPYINFDNTDDFYFPRKGFKIGSSLEFAGLGGDSKYLKSSSYFKYFYSLEDRFDLDWVLRYKAQANFLVDNGRINQGDSLYLGGTRSLRGFKSYSFPSNETGYKQDPYKNMAATAVEISLPLIPDSKMRWGLFYDYGMIGEESLGDIKRSSTGALFEWISPFGPLQLIFAQPLDDKPGDDTSSFEFSLGSSF